MNKLKYVIVALCVMMTSLLSAQVTVNSLAELRTAVLNSNQEIVLTPGDYNFEDLPSGSRDITFSGNNNTITLTGVHIIVPVGSVTQNYLNVNGDNNTIIDGEVEDVYRNGLTEITDFSAYNADRDNLARGLGGDAVMQIIGDGNLLDGFKLTVRGSFPYGYGSMYGIGGENVFGLNKRCGILVTGIGNTIDHVEVQQRAFGHAIFMQNEADQTIIKNTLVEGRVRNTGELYTETEPFDLPSLSGYVMPYEDRAIPTDEFHSLCEDGIRMYNIPGSITVENCTVKKMRGGIRLYLGGEAKVTNSTAIDCGLTNYNTQTGGEIISSSGNFSYTPLLSYRLNRRSTNVELTIIPSPHATGPHNIVDITGNDNTITFHRTPGPKEETDRAIVITSDNNTIINETEYTIILESTANGNEITSCGPVIDNGTNNTIILSACEFEISCSNTADNLQAECHDNMSGIQTEAIDVNNDAVSHIENGNWISFENIDLTDFNAVHAQAGSPIDGAAIEIREGSNTGTLLGTLPIPNTGSFFEYEETTSIDLENTVDGTTTVYFVFTGPSGYLFNLDKISFTKNPCQSPSFDPLLPIEAETFCTSSGIEVEQLSTFNQNIGNINSGDYLVFPNVNFGNDHNYNSLQVHASSTTAGGTVEIRSGAIDGELLASVDIDNTGDWSTYQTFANRIDEPITGDHDIYMVFKGKAGFLFNVDRFRFHEDVCGNITDAYSEIDALGFCESFEVVPINQEYLGGIHHGDWIRFGSVDFSSNSPSEVTLRLAGLSSTDGFVNIMLDDPESGTMIATTTVPATGGWTNWEEVTVPVTQEVTGIHNVYVYFGNSAYNIDWFQFFQDPCDDSYVKDPTRIEAEDYCDMLGVQVESSSNDVVNIGYIENNDWVKYSNYDLTGIKSVAVSASSSTQGGMIEFRLDAIDGDLITSVEVMNTGNWNTYEEVKANIETLDGVHDIYIVFTGGNGYLFNFDWLGFSTESINVDCHGDVNGTATLDACGICSGGNTGITPSSPSIWYEDQDADGLGNGNVSQEACDQPTGYVSNNNDQNDNDFDNDGVNTSEDCNDKNATIGAATTWYEDQDADGLGNSNVSQEACEQPTGYVDNNNDQNDNDFDNDGVNTSEDCNDKNATIGAATTWYEDQDDDGLGNGNVSQEACDQPTGYVANADDTCPTDATNTCNDPQDCAGVINGTATIDDCNICSGGTTGIAIDACLSCNEPYATLEDGENVAGNVLDDDLDTRWSAQGNGEFIELCVGDEAITLNKIALAFYKGDTRTATFDVQVSLNGLEWTTVLENTVSSGTTLALEEYSFEATQVWKIRIVGKGNSDNNWNSVTEIDWQAVVLSSVTQNEEERVKIYPNPTLGYVQFTSFCAYTLTDTYGNVVQTGEGESTQIAHLAAGLYVLRLSRDDKVYHVKLLKE